MSIATPPDVAVIAQSSRATTQRSRSRPWWLLATFVPLLAVSGVFTLSNVFYARDLTNWFRPHHEWFRRTIAEGQLPIWNPYLGGGYSTVNEPALQTFFPLTLPLRFIPGVVGFNLIVALPIAVAGLGTFLFLRRRLTPTAAALGGIVFAASGPMLSTGSMPNLSWSCALMPWALTALDALAASWSIRRVALLAAAFALALLAGEPVTFMATAALALAYALVRGRSVRTTLGAAVALGFAGLLAAIQVLPTAAITAGSIRTSGALRNLWSLHPARLVEMVIPFAFGKPTGYPHEITQWLFVLNERHEPLLASIYLGVPALLLVVLGLRRSATFWAVVACAGLLAAMGSHTTIALLRYPSKYAVVTALAVAVLAAEGWDAQGGKRTPALVLASVLGAIGLTLWLLPIGAPAFTASLATRWGAHLGMPDVASGAQSLLVLMRGGGPRLVALAALGAVLVRASTVRWARLLLFALVAADLVLAGSPINPTIDRSVLAPFDWVAVTREHPADRVFVARDFLKEGRVNEDVAPPAVFPPDRPVVAYQAVYDTALGSDLSASGVSLTLAREVSGLRPREYVWLLERYDASDRAMRYRFLSWTGTRYILAMTPPPQEGAVRRATLPVGSLALFETPPDGARAFVATRAEVEPDTHRQVARLFDSSFDPFATVLLEHAPEPSLDVQTEATPSRVTIREAVATRLVIEVDGSGGYLVLLDSYDSGWSATIDGAAAPVLRADGVYRAVRILAGPHMVVFRYRPRRIIVGAVVSSLSLVMLGMLAAFGQRIGPLSRIGWSRLSRHDGS